MSTQSDAVSFGPAAPKQDPLPGQAQASAAAPKRRRRSTIKTQDVGELKAKKDKLRKELKVLSKEVKLQEQKKRRLLRKESGLLADDLQWILERRRAEENAAKTG